MWKIRDRKAEGPEKQALLYERLRHVAELQGPTYVKLAQLISAAEGVFPEALVAECKNAETRCPLSHGQKFLKSSTTN